ncbi:GTPase-activating protein gyp8 [Coemansia sp. RSA 552]|nr:GTPase-activating protein gyp8 [Coemansia sp. RSA 552]
MSGNGVRNRRAGGNRRRLPRAKRISQAVTKQDLTALKELARTGNGFQTTRLRRRAWPLLLNFRALTLADSCVSSHGQEAHADEGQVALDVARARLPTTTEFRRDEAATRRRQRQLSNVVCGVLRAHPWLSYYQGFHELALTFLCVFGSERAAIEASRMAALFFVRDAMGSSLEHVMQQLQLLYVLLKSISPKVHQMLVQELEVPPFFAISWLLTWFAHDITGFDDVCRIYDFLIVSPPMQVVYMAAAMIKRSEAAILDLDRDFASVHTALSKLPSQIDDWLPVIEESYYLEIEYPATKLQHMGACHLPRLSAINSFEATWKRLDPARPLDFGNLVPVKAAHPLAEKESGGEGNRMARVIDLTSTAQKARNLALEHRWGLAVVTMASATVLMYAWMMMMQVYP